MTDRCPICGQFKGSTDHWFEYHTKEELKQYLMEGAGQ